MESSRPDKGRRPATLREEANAITCHTFRNGHIENLHAATREELEAGSTRERISDADMDTIMSDATRRMTELLAMKRDDPQRYWELIDWYNTGHTRKWDREEPIGKRRRRVPHPAPPPATIAQEAYRIAECVFRNGFIQDIREGRCPELRPYPQHPSISDEEMAVLMITASSRLAELLLLKERDPDYYHYTLALYDKPG